MSTFETNKVLLFELFNINVTLILLFLHRSLSMYVYIYINSLSIYATLILNVFISLAMTDIYSRLSVIMTFRVSEGSYLRYSYQQLHNTAAC